MKKKQECVTVWVVCIGIVSLAVMGGYFGMEEISKHSRLCADQFDTVNYSAWNGFETDLENFGYQEIDKTHYNCCWDEVELSDEGYYTKRKCRGFVR